MYHINKPYHEDFKHNKEKKNPNSISWNHNLLTTGFNMQVFQVSIFFRKCKNARETILIVSELDLT